MMLSPNAADRWLTTDRFPHIAALDGLRAASIAIVFLGHAGLGRILIPGGFGVTIFFFLSGYLITSLLRVEQASTHRIDLKGFYIRRVLRIGPPLWISLIVFGLGSAIGLVPSALDPLAILAQLFFAINYAELWGHAAGVPGMPLWSLAVEEHYYFIFPALYMFLTRRFDVRAIAALSVAACCIALLARCIHVFGFGDTYYTYYFTHTRFDSILFGAILALWHNPALERAAWRPSKWQLTLSLILLAATIVPRSEIFRETIRYSLQGMLLIVIFSAVVADKGWINRLLTLSPVQLIGKYSYTIYLSHYFFLKAVSNMMPGTHKIVTVAIAGAATLLYSAAMYKLVERPAGRLRRKLNPVESPETQRVDVAPVQSTLQGKYL